jgi:hypothetical protein
MLWKEYLAIFSQLLSSGLRSAKKKLKLAKMEEIKDTTTAVCPKLPQNKCSPIKVTELIYKN